MTSGRHLVLLTLFLCGYSRSFSSEESQLFEQIHENPSFVAFTWSKSPTLDTQKGFHIQKKEEFFTELFPVNRLENILEGFKSKDLTGYRFDQVLDFGEGYTLAKFFRNKIRLDMDSFRIPDIHFRPISDEKYENVISTMKHSKRPGEIDERVQTPRKRFSFSSFKAREEPKACRISYEHVNNDPPRDEPKDAYTNEQLEEMMKSYQQVVFFEKDRLTLSLRGVNLILTFRYKAAGLSGKAWVRITDSMLVFPMQLGRDSKTGQPQANPRIDKGGGFFGDMVVRFMTNNARGEILKSELARMACNVFPQFITDTITKALANDISTQVERRFGMVRESLIKQAAATLFPEEEPGIIPMLLVKDLQWRVANNKLVISFYLQHLSPKRRAKLENKYKAWLKTLNDQTLLQKAVDGIQKAAIF